MNGSKTIQTAVRLGAFWARHSVAMIVVVAFACLFWTATYFALLLWAMFAGDGIGGPLVYPVGLLFFLVASTVTSLVLLLPSTALAEWLARHRCWPILAQIPVSVVILSFLCLAVVGIGGATGSHPTIRGASMGFGILLVIHLVPLGIYWWVAQSVPLILSFLRRLLSAFRA